MHTDYKNRVETTGSLNHLNETWTTPCAQSGVGVRVLLGLLIVLGWCFTAIAQVNTASISGTVTDSSGAAVAGAQVTATDPQTGAVTSQTATEGGRYTIPNLTPGLYDIEASHQGFASTMRRGQQLLVGTTATIDFSLQVASVAQTVEVTGAAPLVETTQSDVSRVVETSELDQLPTFSRSFATLAQLSPGVLLNAAGTAVTVGNSLAQATNYIIDGVSVSDMNSGGTELNLAQDWIQEFSVAQVQAPAEYGLATNGYINAITRSGGNQIHGRAYGYFQNAGLNASPAFLPANSSKPPYSLQRLGGYFGGPVQKDKLFYFIGFENLRSNTSIGVNLPPGFNQPFNTSGIFQQPIGNNLGIVKLDYVPNSTDTIHLKGNIQNQLTGNSGVTPTVAVSGGENLLNDGIEYQLIWDKVLSSSMVNEARGWFIRYYQTIHDNQALEQGSYQGISQFGAPAPYPSQATGAGDPFGYYAEIIYTAANATTGINTNGYKIEKYASGADTLTINKGNHTIKFGLESGYRGFTNADLDFNSDGQYTVADGNSPFSPATAAGATGGPPPNSTCTSCYPTALTLYPHTNGDAGTNTATDPYIAAFAQDSWKIKPVLTLNIGLRYDLDFGNLFYTHSPGLNDMTIDYSDLQPRVGFAWTPFHNDHTVIRGGAGIFYNQDHGAWVGVAGSVTKTALKVNGLPATYVWAYNNASNPYCAVPTSVGGVSCTTAVPTSAENALQEVLAYSLATDTTPNFNPNNATAAGSTFQLKMPLGGPTYTVPAIVAPIPPFQPNVDKNFKTPGAFQATIGFQRQFGAGPGLTVSSDFSYNRYYSQGILYNSNVSTTGATINTNYGVLRTMDYQGRGDEYDFRNQIRYNDRRGDSLQVAYTLGYSYDNWPSTAAAPTYSISFSSAPLAANPMNPNTDWGPGGSMPRNILNASGVIKIALGIQLAPIMQFNNGLPFTPTTSARAGALVSSCPIYYDHCYPAAPYNTKNQFVGGNFFTLGSRLSKRFAFRERYGLMLALEGYNITNRLNDTSYNLNFTSNGTTKNASFGVPTAGGPTRQLQAAFQFDF